MGIEHHWKILIDATVDQLKLSCLMALNVNFPYFSFA